MVKGLKAQSKFWSTPVGLSQMSDVTNLRENIAVLCEISGRRRKRSRSGDSERSGGGKGGSGKNHVNEEITYVIPLVFETEKSNTSLVPPGREVSKTGVPTSTA